MNSQNFESKYLMIFCTFQEHDNQFKMLSNYLKFDPKFREQKVITGTSQGLQYGES